MTDLEHAVDISWSHFNPVRIQVGVDLLDGLERHMPSGKVLLLTSAGFTRRGVAERIVQAFGEMVTVYDKITPNPDLDRLDELTSTLRSDSYEAIIALGGGSVIDSAKVLSVTLPTSLGRPLDQVLRGGLDQAWSRHLPVLACPTTAGTGAEVTPFATVWDGRRHQKLSLADEALFPAAAILDPALTLTLPRQETLYTGLDVISHALESLWNKNRTPISETCATRALQMAVEALPSIRIAPNQLAPRAQMHEASLLAGLAISQTRTAIAHSISYPLTSHFGVPHGLASGFLLSTILARLQHEGIDLDVSDSLIDATQKLLDQLGLPSEILRYVSQSQIADLQSEMYTSSRADNFALPSSFDLIGELLEGMLEERS